MPDKKKLNSEDVTKEDNNTENDDSSLELSPKNSENFQEVEDESSENKGNDDERPDTSADMKDQLLRALADVENMRRRSERDVAQANKFGHLAFARDLLSCFDNLSQAVALAPEDRSNFDENGARP